MHHTLKQWFFINDRPKTIDLKTIELPPAIYTAFEKINENQDEINKACTHGVNNRMRLCVEKQGCHIEQYRTGCS